MSTARVDLKRRDALRKIAWGGLGAATAPLWVENLGALAHARAHAHAPQAASPPSEAWTPKVLDAHQDELVTTLSELIIPQTETPGAKAAFVNRFIDAVLADADDADRDSFLRGLAWMDDRSQKVFGVEFVQADAAQQAALLTPLAAEKNRSLEDQIGEEAWTGRPFFEALKAMTVMGYYTSEVGMKQELGEDGSLFFAAFNGCVHPEHGGTAGPTTGSGRP
jgi:hypothetical protein